MTKIPTSVCICKIICIRGFRAYMERPETAIQVIQLLDNGVGADINGKNDGIYSRYYIDPSSADRYTLVCDVKSTTSTYIENGEPDQQLRTATGDFARYKSGGGFRVTLITPCSIS